MLLMMTALIIENATTRYHDHHRRIGLAGFDNPMRDSKTEEVKRHIGQVRKSSKMRKFRKTHGSSENSIKMGNRTFIQENVN